MLVRETPVLCQIWGCNSGAAVACEAVSFSGRLGTSRRNVVPSSSGSSAQRQSVTFLNIRVNLFCIRISLLLIYNFQNHWYTMNHGLNTYFKKPHIRNTWRDVSKETRKFNVKLYSTWSTHTNKCTKTSFVIDFFIKRLPQYAFRHLCIAIVRGIVEVCT